MALHTSLRASSPVASEPTGRPSAESRRDSLEKLGAGDAGAEQKEALLASEDGDLEKLQALAQPTRRSKRTWILTALSVVVLAVIVLFDVRLLFQPDHPNSSNPESALAGNSTAPLSPELEALMRKSFKRPEEEYILDAKWDFAAPPQIRYYNWTIVDKVGNPDGVSKPMMMINGQFPGPMMEVNEGDTIVVDVLNMAQNATAMHWHGIFQNGTNFMDGATGATQCPIPPGQSFQYRFTVDNQSGTCRFLRSGGLPCPVHYLLMAPRFLPWPSGRPVARGPRRPIGDPWTRGGRAAAGVCHGSGHSAAGLVLRPSRWTVTRHAVSRERGLTHAQWRPYQRPQPGRLQSTPEPYM